MVARLATFTVFVTHFAGKQGGCMGIDIEADGTIRFNGSHERLLNTSTDKNPSIKIVKGLWIQSVFRRVQTSGDVRDGNPFIYALKDKNGYKIDRRELWKFRVNFSAILEKALQEIDVDYVIPMPSGHKVASYLAFQVAKRHGGAPTVIPNALRKRTVGEMLAAYADYVPDTGKYKTREYKSQIRKWAKMPSGTFVSMKEVDSSVRNFFHPLALSGGVHAFNGKRVLLVDDLLSSGSTLKCAQALVEERQAVEVSALCLLSSL